MLDLYAKLISADDSVLIDQNRVNFPDSQKRVRKVYVPAHLKLNLNHLRQAVLVRIVELFLLHGYELIQLIVVANKNTIIIKKYYLD